MKRYIKSSKHDDERIISYNLIYDYISNMNESASYPLSEDELRSVAEELDDAIYREEMESGEWYESIYDADIEGLFDASDEPIHTLGYRLMDLYERD